MYTYFSCITVKFVKKFYDKNERLKPKHSFMHVNMRTFVHSHMGSVYRLHIISHWNWNNKIASYIDKSI